MKIIFSHGKESGPWGTKIKRLAKIAEQLNCSVESIDYQGMQDADSRVEKLVQHLKDETEEYILVGSSMGGYVSLVAASQLNPRGLFLLAPALYMPGYESKDYALNQNNVCIVHAWEDEIIPYENVLLYAKRTQCELHLVNSDHRLVSVLENVRNYFITYLRPLLLDDNII